MLIKTTNFILRLVLGAVMILAGALKVFDPAGFAINIQHYRLLPNEFINLVAITLPWVELVAGLGLVMGVWIRASALLSALMSVVFTSAVALAMWRGLNIECGCFGTVAGTQVGMKHLVIDLALLASSLWLVWKEKNSGDHHETPDRRQ